MRAALPARPDVRHHPAVLGERIAAAEARARSARTLLPAVEELGRLYHANGYTPEAEACWRLLCARRPDEPRWWYYRAVLRLADNDYDAATTLLRETLSRAPDYSPAYLQLANLQLKTGELEGAERDYQRRLALVPRDPYARLGLVRLALLRQRTGEARGLLEELLKDAPNFSTAHSLYAEILAGAGDEKRASWHRWLGVETIRYTEPEDSWLEELEPWCHDYDRLCVLGSVESMREHRDRARALFERAIQVNPAAFDAYQLLSALYFKQEQPAQARDLLEQARPRLAPANPTAWFTYLCRAYRLLGQPAEAERVAREGLALKSDSPELLEALGLALADLGRHTDAVPAYETALGRNPNDASINYNLAVSLLALRRLDDVLAALDRSLTLQPAFPPTLLLRARIEMAAAHWPEAETYLRPLIESHPDDAEARRLFAEWHQHMGAAAEKRGEPAEAERYYQSGLALDPNAAELHVRLGAFYLVHRRFADAIQPLEAHHRLQPESAPGCLFLGQAYAATGRRDEAREVLKQGEELAGRAGNARTARACRELLERL
ncbi:tetratricopeptide repeat protein [Opitutus terrae]|uniref:tetratricopeptide repeat protein n=1 Tax=Opitutus terrae TaxID=107709 RepID=UPI0005D12EA0|nr:tetratricopeptide repeat protein [Opitutus terrae]